MIDDQFRLLVETYAVQLTQDKSIKYIWPQGLIPNTQLSVGDYAELQRLLKVQYGTLFERGLSGELLEGAEQELLLAEGEKIFSRQGINALYYFWQTISANDQVAIDEYLKDLALNLEIPA